MRLTSQEKLELPMLSQLMRRCLYRRLYSMRHVGPEVAQFDLPSSGLRIEIFRPHRAFLFILSDIARSRMARRTYLSAQNRLHQSLAGFAMENLKSNVHFLSPYQPKSCLSQIYANLEDQIRVSISESSLCTLFGIGYLNHEWQSMPSESTGRLLVQAQIITDTVYAC
jgi:hypothetical protein